VSAAGKCEIGFSRSFAMDRRSYRRLRETNSLETLANYTIICRAATHEPVRKSAEAKTLG